MKIHLWLFVSAITLGLTFGRRLVLPIKTWAITQGYLSLSAAKIYFTQERANLSFQVNNRSLRQLELEGTVSLFDGEKTPLWVKNLPLTRISPHQALEFNFDWSASNKLIGKSRVEIILKDTRQEVVLREEINFFVFPGVLGGASLLSLIFLGNKGLGRILSFV